jgi:hypothetical protein
LQLVPPLHVGTVVASSSGRSAAPILRVDARNDRLVETVRGRVVRSIAFADVVSYAADDDDDGDDNNEDDGHLEDRLEDEDRQEAARTSITITVRAKAARVIRHSAPDDEDDDAEDDADEDDAAASAPCVTALDYRLQSAAELAAVRHVLGQLATRPPTTTTTTTLPPPPTTTTALPTMTPGGLPGSPLPLLGLDGGAVCTS